MRTVAVGLGKRSYEIHIGPGLMAGLGERIASMSLAKRYGVVTDDTVAALYGGKIVGIFTAAGVAAEMLVFPAGEASKNLGTVEKLARELARRGFDRKDGLIALGGGVVGDITGFLAAIYMRGLPFIQVPTTLLAQVDSSVGGKTGVDIPEGKNLVGAFHQPQAVFIDTALLSSLADKEMRNGLAEVIKYGVSRDAVFFAMLSGAVQAVAGRDPELLEEIIARSCALKAQVVAADETEDGLRRVLNFGHTIGHAVEAASDFRLAHGVAVAIGMAAVCRLAVLRRQFSAAASAEVLRLIEAYGLPTEIPAELDRGRIMAHLKSDKKTVGGRPVFVLPVSIGSVVMEEGVGDDEIRQVIAGAG